MVQSSAPNRVIKSKAKALEVHPAYGPEVGSRGASDARLVAPAPPLVVPGSSTVNGESKKRMNGVDEAQANPNAPKRPKLAADAAPSPSGVNQPPPPTSAAPPGAQPPVRPVIKRPPPSLFVPKKVCFFRSRSQCARTGSLISLPCTSASNFQGSSLARQRLSVVLSISHVIIAIAFPSFLSLARRVYSASAPAASIRATGRVEPFSRALSVKTESAAARDNVGNVHSSSPKPRAASF